MAAEKECTARISHQILSVEGEEFGLRSRRVGKGHTNA